MATVIGNPNTMNRLVAPAGANVNTQPQVQPQPQSTQQQPQQQVAAPDLNDFTYFNNRSVGGIGEGEQNSPRAQQMLENLRRYDPNATFEPSFGSDDQLLGYTLNFDPRKLPGVNGSGQLGQGAAGVGTGNTFMPRFSTVQQHMNLANPNAVMNSPVYGKITDNRNIYDKQDWISKYGPAIIGAIGMFGGLGPLGSMLLRAPQTIAGMTQGGFNPFQLASMAVPFIPGIGNVPFLSSAARMGLNYVGSQRRGG